MTDPVEQLVEAIKAASDIPADDLLNRFALATSGLNEAEFARSFDAVNALYHRWMSAA